MTTLEMQQLFETLLQTSSKVFNDSEKPDTDTIFRYLNQAQVEYIRTRYLSSPSYVERSRIIGENAQDLDALIEQVTHTVAAGTPYTYSKIFSPDKNVWHHITLVGEVLRTYPFATNGTMDLEPINATDLDKYITTVVNKPILTTPVFTGISTSGAGKVLVIYDAYTTYSNSNTKGHCLVFPKTLVLVVADANTETTTCELADYLHQDVVKLAVGLYEAQKYKLMTKQEDKK